MVNKFLYLFLICVLSLDICFSQITHTYEKIGTISPLTSKQISFSRWSIGGETLDRDYVDYQNYKFWLDSLGAKRIRLQAGWAKCEKNKGEYDFSWLDEIVFDANKRGVKPWLNLSYGNPIYEGGGTPFLGSNIPEGEEALAAWDNWVSSIVRRYKDVIIEWEIWNEPDLKENVELKEFTSFHIRTCEVIKREQPNSRIIALALTNPDNILFATSILDSLKSLNKLDWFDAISYHGYLLTPEKIYPRVQKLIQVVKSYSPEIEIWQGENGAPSTLRNQSVGAMSKFDWSELSQAKWILRRMLSDIYFEIDITNIFTISDIWYDSDDYLKGYNSKGLLKANPDKTIERPKISYRAFQNIATIFSGEINKIENVYVTDSIDKLRILACNRDSIGGNAVIFWFHDDWPKTNYKKRNLSLKIKGVNLNKPLLVDLITGNVYAIPEASFLNQNDGFEIKEVVIKDYPIALIDIIWLEQLGIFRCAR